MCVSESLRSGSATSLLNACTSKWSSYLRFISVQSSNSKCANNASPPPISHTSSTEKMSAVPFSPSSSPSAPFSFAAACFCFACHSATLFCHSANWDLDHSEGCKSSTREFRFFCRTQFVMYSSHLSADCHSYWTSSKPSSSMGSENEEKLLFKTWTVKSGTKFGLNHNRSSSSVSSASGGAVSSSSSFSSSLTSTFGSSFTSSLASVLTSSFTSLFTSAFTSAFTSVSFFSSFDSSTSIFVS
mmetsp:Transcript_89290/g.251310  ORF Transcript_89290/g.251310 Transcript_89290/m.251310 type:complete len:243 (+) Transcript_89290:857-1585(+)